MMSSTKSVFLSLFLFASIGGLGFHIFGTQSISQSSLGLPSSSAKLYKNWEKDLKILGKKKQLPGGFNSIKQISYTPLSKMSAQWMSRIQIPIAIKHNGKYKLNLEVDHWTEKKKAAAIVHYQLVEIATGNTVWEFGRTYPIR